MSIRENHGQTRKSPSGFRHWLPRYSLRTLLLATILAGGIGLLCRSWEPWPVKKILFADRVREASFSPDGKWLMVCSGKSSPILRLPDAAVFCRLAHPQTVRNAVWSPDRRLLCTIADDKATRIWDTRTWQCLHVLENSAGYSSPDFSPDWKRILTRPDNRRHQLWNMESGMLLAEFGERYNFKNFSRDGRYLLFEIYWNYDGKERSAEQESDRGAEVWDAISGKKLWFARNGEDSRTESLRFSDDQRCVISEEEEIGDNFNTTAIRNVFAIQSGELVEQHRTPKDGWSRSVSFSIGGFRWRDQISPDGSRVLRLKGLQIVLEDNVAKRSLEMLPGFEMNEDTATASFSPDGAQIVAGNWRFRNELFVWKRRRPEYWWGIAWLPEFWLLVILTSAFLWSLLRDRRDLRRTPAIIPEPPASRPP
ncbi:MAG TPA: hypothetical protein VKX17_25160 [Planctomycetota bacterium]|nr:hypothetical protein [Planctomycetota bacterium]